MKTGNSSPHKPHDQFFRFIFSGKPQVVSFLKGSLPEGIQAKLDFESLQLMSGHHIDDQLRDHLSDLLYTCQFEGNEIGIAILLEHKSFTVRYPHFQILRYMLGFWERQVQNGHSPSPIIPIVVYHGRRRWRYIDMEAYFEALNPELRDYLPDFQYLLIDLMEKDHEIIMAQYEDFVLQKALLLMKFIFSEDFGQRLSLILEGFKSYLEDKQEEEVFRRFIVYISRHGTQKKEEIMDSLDQLIEDWQPEPNSLLMDWITEAKAKIEKARKEAFNEAYNEASEKAMQQNEAERKKEINRRVLKMLSLEIPLEKIALIMEMSPEEIKQIIAQSKRK